MLNEENFTRPTTIQEMQERFKDFATQEGWQLGLDYKPDPTDVFIVTPPKCGTTWMQQIVHGLRTRGSMDFDEISRVVPWINMACDLDMDIYAPQVARPHAFKTHSHLNEVPRGGKYIVIVRDPCDALLSDYHFMEGMFFEAGTISLEVFAREEFMQEHRDQFEDHIVRKARSAAMRLPPDGKLNKVRTGQVEESKLAVPDDIKKELEVIWHEEITTKIGLNSYEDLRNQLVN